MASTAPARAARPSAAAARDRSGCTLFFDGVDGSHIGRKKLSPLPTAGEGLHAGSAAFSGGASVFFLRTIIAAFEVAWPTGWCVHWLVQQSKRRHRGFSCPVLVHAELFSLS